MVLPKGFNELELLQVEADFYQIEELISAIEDHKRIAELKEGDVIAALFIISHSNDFYGDFCSVYKRKKKLILKGYIVVLLFVAIQKSDHTWRMIVGY